MSSEIYWLTLTVLMTALFWVPYILNRIVEKGFINAFSDPEGVTETGRHWAQRMMKAHINAVENLVIFVPLVLIVEMLKINSETTATACVIYFAARLTHFLVYSAAVPYLRVMSFLVGVGAQLTLALAILGS